MSPSTTQTEQLAALVAAKQQVLEILVRLSRHQVEVIDAGDMTLLMKLLAGKHTVMTQLQTIERELTPFRDEDPEARTWRSPGERVACQARAEQCNSLLAEAMKLEKQAEAAMLDRRDAAAVALSAIQIGSDAKAAYAATPLSSASMQVEG